MNSNTPIKVLSFGGGLDSRAMWLDAVDRGELPDVVVFADVTNNRVNGDNRRDNQGHWPDPGEWDATYRFIEEVQAPECEEQGVPFVWLTTDDYPIRPNARPGGYRSLFEYALVKNMFYARTSKSCTCAAKVERIRDFCNDMFPDQDVEMWIGFEANETGRAERDPRGPNGDVVYKPGEARIRNRFPLIERQLCRCRCEALVAAVNPRTVPRKSACVFCPNSSRGDLATLREHYPQTFDRVCGYEDNGRLTSRGIKLRFSGDPNWALRDYAAGRAPYDSDMLLRNIAKERNKIIEYNHRVSKAKTPGKQQAAARMRAAARKRLAAREVQLQAHLRGEMRLMAPYQRDVAPCGVWGAPQTATKATGCGPLSEDEMLPRTRAALRIIQ